GSVRDPLRVVGPWRALAGVPTVVQAAPGLTRRLTTAKPLPSGLPALGLCLVIAWTGVTLWQGWLPGGPGINNPSEGVPINETISAFKFPLPQGRYPRVDPPGQTVCRFPVDPIKARVSPLARPA